MKKIIIILITLILFSGCTKYYDEVKFVKEGEIPIDDTFKDLDTCETQTGALIKCANVPPDNKFYVCEIGKNLFGERFCKH